MATLPSKIVLASGNAGKLKEIERILEGLDVEVVPQSEFGVTDADETGTTFDIDSGKKCTIKAGADIDVNAEPNINLNC